MERIPGMTTAMFSILSPRKHIEAHRGPYKGVLRYHLGLVVPREKERCRIRVGEDIRHWEEGRSLVFDDTYDHEVWNDTDDLRVVLFVDVIRPLPVPESLVNRAILKAIGWSPFVQDAKRNQEAWERSYREYQRARDATSAPTGRFHQNGASDAQLGRLAVGGRVGPRPPRRPAPHAGSVWTTTSKMFGCSLRTRRSTCEALSCAATSVVSGGSASVR